MILLKTLGIIIPIVAGLILITFNIALGTESEIGPIICTIFLIPLLFYGVNYPLYRLNFSFTTAYNFGLLLLNDVLMRSISSELTDWITKSFYIVLSLSVLVMIIRAIHLGKSGQSFGRCPLTRTLIVLLGAACTVLVYRFTIN